MNREKNIKEQVLANEICPICKRWMGPVHICPEQIARDCEIKPKKYSYVHSRECRGLLTDSECSCGVRQVEIQPEDTGLPGIAFRHSGEVAPLLAVEYEGRWMTPQECIARQQAIIDRQEEQLSQDSEIQPEESVVPGYSSGEYLTMLKLKNEEIERLEGELHNAIGYVESKHAENERLQRVESEIDAWVSAHDGDISQVDAIDIIIKAAKGSNGN